MFKLTVGFALVSLVACLQCPSDDVCEAGQTCCQTPNEDISCCPFNNGECCEDHLHCCPEGMLCQVMGSVCQNATHSLPWMERMHVEGINLPKSFRMIPSLLASEDDITCPDGSHCPSEFSCLLISTSYGCCPVAQGIVCSDGKHCCSTGHECSADSSSCVKPKVKTVLCGDGKSECPVDTTCCETDVNGQWACCPMSKDLPIWDKFPARIRTEWEDHKEAAVATKEINTEAKTTTNGPITTTVSQGVFLENFNVPCDDTVACPDNFTCCKTKDGGWACCPLPQAVCCDDFIHCCPHDQTCDVAAGKCNGLSGSVPWSEKFPVRPISSQNLVGLQVFNVPCDDTVACPDNSTCCKTKDGGWACCPLPQAECCDDFVHCCPHGQTCDVAAGKCNGQSGSVPWSEKFPVRLISSQNLVDTQVFNVPCDDTVACPDNFTCCKTKDAGWACCPLPQAVCCDDFIHCCPHGQTCDVAAGKCNGQSGSVPWSEKFPVQPIRSQNLVGMQVFNVPCDDTVACSDNSTCCKTKDGRWACCPLPQAVCCDDFIHCCPHGQTCDVAAGKCNGQSGSVPWSEKFPVRPISSQNLVDTQVCPSSVFNVPCDDTVACPDNFTCCKTKDAGWACCPLPQAVCCDDFIHCCPHGQTCDVAAGKCNGQSGSVPWSEKFPVQPIRSQNLVGMQVFNVPCDDTVACSDNSTCCKTKDGRWACCPLPQAVCCDDFIHCCPHGQTCDVAAGKCNGQSGSVPWSEKFPVRPISSQNLVSTQVFNVPCDDTVACPDNFTCCKTKDAGWACCPLPQAVCCDDFIHCCPHGQTCDLAAGKCNGQSGSVPWSEKVPARLTEGQRVSENVSCDSSHICPESNTCCKNIDGHWNCCPMPEATCCWDRLHCCPKGTTCNFQTLTCDSGSTSVPMTLILPGLVKKDHRQAKYEEVKEQKGEGTKYNGRILCDEHTSCPDHTTCCLITKTNKWGCCPLPNAICCSDGEHCCPTGYKCDVSKVSCIQNNKVIPWYDKTTAQGTPAPRSGAVSCDEKFRCSVGSTCCRLITGDWGCCPLSEAVCCQDHEHCCPKGYTCDMGGKSCVKNLWLQMDRVPITYIHDTEPQQINPNPKKDIHCGGKYSCLDGETCCPTSETTWACCPSKKAVCCDDMKHCCPAGYKCGDDETCVKASGLQWNSRRNWSMFFHKNI